MDKKESYEDLDKKVQKIEDQVLDLKVDLGVNIRYIKALTQTVNNQIFFRKQT